MSRRIAPLLLLLALSAPLAGAEEGEAAPQLRLLPVREGILRAVVRGDLTKLGDAAIQKQAARVGIDLAEPPQRLVVHRFANERLFYVFYKVAEKAHGDASYLIQRIKRTERNWRGPDDEDPEEEVTYQVEVFKLQDGALKRPDQHYGSYGIRGYHRREIVKEYEIGFGTIPGTCEGSAWPFDPGILFKYLYRYGPSREVYDAVAWTSRTPWTLRVELDAEGDYRIAAPALGFDLPGSPPAAEEDVVLLVPGLPPDGMAFGVSTPDDLRAARGEPVAGDDPPVASLNCVYEDGLTFNFNALRRLNSVFTSAGFTGRTRDGLGHGDTRGLVIDRMGPPPGDTPADAGTWFYPAQGIGFWFDARHRVEKIVLFAPRTGEE